MMPKGLVVQEKLHQGMTMLLGEQQFGLQWVPQAKYGLYYLQKGWTLVEEP